MSYEFSNLNNKQKQKNTFCLTQKIDFFIFKQKNNKFSNFSPANFVFIVFIV